MVNSQRREEAWEVRKLEEYLETWVLQCPLCVVRRCDGYGHSIEDCSQDGASIVREGIMDLQEQVQFERFSCCFIVMCRRPFVNVGSPAKRIFDGRRLRGKVSI